MTVSRDGTAFLWNTETGKKDLQLHYSADHEDESIFRFRNCRHVNYKHYHIISTFIFLKVCFFIVFSIFLMPSI